MSAKGVSLSVRDLSWLLFDTETGHARMLAMLKAYFDESYDADVVAVGGWIGTAKQWKRVERGWKSILDDVRDVVRRSSSDADAAKVRVLGCADLLSAGDIEKSRRKPHYAALGLDGRARVFSECVATIRKHLDAGIVISVALSELRSATWRLKLPDRQLIALAYQICGLGCIVEGMRYADSAPVGFIFEHGMRGSGALVEAAEVMLSQTRERRVRIPLPFSYKSECIVLQTADFIAWAHHRYAAQVHRTGIYGELPEATEKIAADLQWLGGGEYEREGLARIVAGLRPRNGPPDLARAMAEAAKIKMPRGQYWTRA